MQHRHHPDVREAFHFTHSNNGDLIFVFNSDNYLMAQYNMRTGHVGWQRVVLATQRDAVEKWLREAWPVKPAVKPVAAVPVVKKKLKKA